VAAAEGSAHVLLGIATAYSEIHEMGERKLLFRAKPALKSGASLGGGSMQTNKQEEGHPFPQADGAVSDGEIHASRYTRALLPRCIARKRDMRLQRANDAALVLRKIVFF
jgi:hypothetical protein